jgi:RNA polymerase sigma-70 factor (ECF subfamily)
LHRRRRSPESLDDHDFPDAALDPELGAIQARHRTDFKQAFQVAVASLSPRDRAVLRALIVDDRSVGDIATLYQIHRVTASRWLADIRRTLLRETRRWLKDRLALDAPSLDSATRMLDSQLDVSLYRLLATDP